jgi:hypothetical protein
VEASRQILFGLHSRIGLNFGVLFAWAAVNTALVSLYVPSSKDVGVVCVE